MLRPLAWILALLAPAAAAQQPALKHVLATDFAADGAVVALTVPAALEGGVASLGWRAARGPMHATRVVLHRGTHLHDFRDAPGWEGRIALLAADVPGLRAEVRAAGPGDELALFAQPAWLAATSVNVMPVRRLYGVRWYAMLALLAAGGALLAWWRGAALAPALVLGLLLASTAAALRGLVDHAANVQNPAGVTGQPAALRDAADRFAQAIGAGTWRDRGVSGYADVVLRYRLAAHRYSPPGTGRPDFLITTLPLPGELVLEAHGLRLLRLAE